MTDIITDFAAIAKLARFRDTPPQSEEVHMTQEVGPNMFQRADGTWYTAMNINDFPDWKPSTNALGPSYLEQSDDDDDGC